MIIGSCLGIFYQMLQKPQLREKAILVLKKNTTQTKQNKTLAQRESGNRYETHTHKKNPGKMKIYIIIEERQI